MPNVFQKVTQKTLIFMWGLTRKHSYICSKQHQLLLYDNILFLNEYSKLHVVYHLVQIKNIEEESDILTVRSVRCSYKC